MGRRVQIGEGEPPVPSGILDTSYQIPPAPSLPALMPSPMVAPPAPPPTELPPPIFKSDIYVAPLAQRENVVLDLSPVLMIVRVPETGEFLGLVRNPFKQKKEGDWFPNYSILSQTELLGLGLGAGMLVVAIVKRKK